MFSTTPATLAASASHPQWSPRSGFGFSLVELLVVVAILSVLASIGLPLAEMAQKRSKEEALRGALRDIRTALDAYKKSVELGHITRRTGDSGYPPSLDVLVNGVVDAQSPRGEKLYFMRSLPRDPFALPAMEKAADTWALRSYASPPDNPQPGADVYDVHSKSTDKGMNGVPYKTW